MDNTEAMATLGTRDTRQINVRENRKGGIKNGQSRGNDTLGTQETRQINVRENGGAITNGQSRGNVNFWYTRQKTNKCYRKTKMQSRMDNTEAMATLDTQDTRQINVRENRRGNQEWTFQRQWQHWVHKT